MVDHRLSMPLLCALCAVPRIGETALPLMSDLMPPFWTTHGLGVRPAVARPAAWEVLPLTGTPCWLVDWFGLLTGLNYCCSVDHTANLLLCCGLQPYQPGIQVSHFLLPCQPFPLAGAAVFCQSAMSKTREGDRLRTWHKPAWMSLASPCRK